MLENLAHAFTHPSIMDAKLGTVLHEPSANAEKRAKMEHQAQSTTTATTGLRLTGCQVGISSETRTVSVLIGLGVARAVPDVHVDAQVVRQGYRRGSTTIRDGPLLPIA